jgi:hypothetical protein
MVCNARERYEIQGAVGTISDCGRLADAWVIKGPKSSA